MTDSALLDDGRASDEARLHTNESIGSPLARIRALGGYPIVGPARQ